MQSGCISLLINYFYGIKFSKHILIIKKINVIICKNAFITIIIATIILSIVNASFHDSIITSKSIQYKQINI